MGLPPVKLKTTMKKEFVFIKGQRFISQTEQELGLGSVEGYGDENWSDGPTSWLGGSKIYWDNYLYF